MLKTISAPAIPTAFKTLNALVWSGLFSNCFLSSGPVIKAVAPVAKGINPTPEADAAIIPKLIGALCTIAFNKSLPPFSYSPFPKASTIPPSNPFSLLYKASCFSLYSCSFTRPSIMSLVPINSLNASTFVSGKPRALLIGSENAAPINS